jgi:hypothetical protein
MRMRGPGWRRALESWECGSDSNETECDPCGEVNYKLSASWEGMACRGKPGEEGWVTCAL